MWSGDTAGQGWGIDEARGGMRTYATMLRNRPDFFIHSGDTIYADDPILAAMGLPDEDATPRATPPPRTKSRQSRSRRTPKR